MNNSPLSLAPLAFAALSALATAQSAHNPPLSGPAIGPQLMQNGIQSTADLVAPDTASLIAGGGSIFNWLNVVNVPVTIEEAMTSMPVEDAGYANADVGTVIEVKFASGVTNNAGPDIAMLDSVYDVGSYAIRTDYDGFAASVVADMAVGVYCTSEAYFYGGAGPYGADVYSVEIDLDSLGVPAGATVTALRFETLNSSCDPITLAKIGNDFTLTVSTLNAGQVGNLKTSYGTPGGRVGMAYSLRGPGPTSLNTGVCGTLSVDLSAPVKVLALGTNDANGDFSYSGNVPPSASGVRVWFQALDFASCTLSNGVATVIN
ncbi:MAG: hypothetical protein CMJ94_07985 [Planctomycetes bacterium]|nr:hypothetical protein [Planctomycetota bacterium]